MSDISPILSLPYIQPSQAQKHVTHNEALQLLDVLTQLVVANRDQTVPPVPPVTGTSHIVAPGGTGAWAGRDGEIATWDGAAWFFVAPQTGWQAQVTAEAQTVTWDGAAWGVQPPELQNLDHVGIRTTADATNRLAVSASATLLSHDGAGHQLKINKSTGADTASLLFQTGWSGRAELGTVSFPSGTTELAPSQFGTSSLLTTNCMTAKGDGLVANGTCLLVMTIISRRPSAMTPPPHPTGLPVSSSRAIMLAPRRCRNWSQ